MRLRQYGGSCSLHLPLRRKAWRYQRRSDEMFARYEDAEKALAATQGSLHQKEKKMEQIESFITEVEPLPDCITEFRTDYWGHLVKSVTVHRKGKLVFTFSCGVEIGV